MQIHNTRCEENYAVLYKGNVGWAIAEIKATKKKCCESVLYMDPFKINIEIKILLCKEYIQDKDSFSKKYDYLFIICKRDFRF